MRASPEFQRRLVPFSFLHFACIKPTYLVAEHQPTKQPPVSTYTQYIFDKSNKMQLLYYILSAAVFAAGVVQAMPANQAAMIPPCLVRSVHLTPQVARPRIAV